MALVLNGSANTLTGLATAGAGIPGSEVVAAAALANGGIIQVKNAIKTTHQQIDDDAWDDIITCDITPTAATNTILVTCSICASCSDAAMLALYRDAAKIGAGTAGSGSADQKGFALVRDGATNEADIYSTTFLDDISTGSAWSSGAITYRVKGIADTSVDMYINRRSSSDAYGLSSTITLMEVVA